MTNTVAILPVMFQHDMAKGFPLLTTKKMGYKNIRSETEFFIKGITDKRWLQDRGNHIWDEWCNPEKVPYGHDMETKKRMKDERDLGPVYGFQWRHFGAEYGRLSENPVAHWAKWLTGGFKQKDYEIDYAGRGVDQLASVVDTLKVNPADRRMITSAWNPEALPEQALPPCHYGFQVNVIDYKLNLAWSQRSVDVPLGLPFNIAGYATILHLLAKESRLKEGTLTGFLMDVHAYENQLGGLEEQISREPLPLPRIETENFSSIFDWGYDDTKLLDYESHPGIKFPIAI